MGYFSCRQFISNLFISNLWATGRRAAKAPPAPHMRLWWWSFWSVGPALGSVVTWCAPTDHAPVFSVDSEVVDADGGSRVARFELHHGDEPDRARARFIDNWALGPEADTVLASVLHHRVFVEGAIPQHRLLVLLSNSTSLPEIRADLAAAVVWMAGGSVVVVSDYVPAHIACDEADVGLTERTDLRLGIARPAMPLRAIAQEAAAQSSGTTITAVFGAPAIVALRAARQRPARTMDIFAEYVRYVHEHTGSSGVSEIALVMSIPLGVSFRVEPEEHAAPRMCDASDARWVRPKLLVFAPPALELWPQLPTSMNGFELPADVKGRDDVMQVELSLFARRAARERLLFENVVLARRMDDWNTDDRRGKSEGTGSPAPATCFTVLVVLQGPSDVTTAGVFDDLAQTLAAGLVALGYSARVQSCEMLGACGVDDGSQVIVLAAHNLARFIDDVENVPVLLSRERGTGTVAGNKLLPSHAILYNFEHVPSKASVIAELNDAISNGTSRVDSAFKNSQGSFISPDTVALLRRYRVWDYSMRNVAALAQLGIAATLVPLGYSPALRVDPALKNALYTVRSEASDEATVVQCTQDVPSRSRGQTGYEQIDVLFYGTLTSRRARLLAELRAPPAPLRVVHANAANNGTFGHALDLLLLDAKITLNLLAFDDDAEWKISRFSRLLANRRFIISEAGGAPAEMELYAEGVVFVENATQLKLACEYFLAHPHEREHVARRGHEIFATQNMGEVLRRPVSKLPLPSAPQCPGTLSKANN